MAYAKTMWRFGVLGMACVTLAGCGGGNTEKIELVKASGSVSYNGSPVTKGTVAFFPTFDAPVAKGKIKEDGTFTLGTFSMSDGAAVGEFRVAIIAQDEAELVSALPEDFDITAEPDPLVPRKYMSQATSGLVVRTDPRSNNEFHFDLED